MVYHTLSGGSSGGCRIPCLGGDSEFSKTHVLLHTGVTFLPVAIPIEVVDEKYWKNGS